MTVTHPVVRPSLLAVSGATALAFAVLAALALGIGFGIALAVVVLALHALVLASRQQVTVDGGKLVIRDGVGPLAYTRRFELAEVRDLRVEPSSQERIRFEHGGRTHGFGAALAEDEAERLAARVREALR